MFCVEYPGSQTLPNVHRAIVYASALIGVGALVVVRFGWGVSYNPILTPFGVMVVGAALLVFVLTHFSQATFARTSFGAIVLIIATLYLVNLLRVTGPTENGDHLMEAIAAVLLWAPMGLGVLIGFVSTDDPPSSTIENPQWVVCVLGLLTQVAAVLILETFVWTNPPVFAGLVYVMLAVFGAIAWVASYPFYRVGRDLR